MFFSPPTDINVFSTIHYSLYVRKKNLNSCLTNCIMGIQRHFHRLEKKSPLAVVNVLLSGARSLYEADEMIAIDWPAMSRFSLQ